MSFSFSYAFLIAVLVVLHIAQLPVSLFAPVIIVGSIVFGALWMARLFWLKRITENLKASGAAGQPRYLRYRPPILISFALVLGLLWIYLRWAGPYLEIPADAWHHISRFQGAMSQLDTGKFEGLSSIRAFFLQHAARWNYLIVAFLCRWSGLSIPQALTPLTIANLSFFCSGIFFFALALFRNFRMTISQKSALAAAAAIFCAVSMGISVFAYIRYYAFAPTILNYILFLSAAIIAQDWLDAKKWRSPALWIIPLLILVINTVHMQEALFACFMIMGMALVNIARRRRGLPIKSIITAGISLIVWLGFFFWMRHENQIIWPEPNTIMPNMPVPAVSVPLIFKAFTISPPHHPILRLFVYQAYMMYETISCWGLFVYLLFIIWFRRLSKSSYLVAGMAMPLLTIFNPITVDMFVRLSLIHIRSLPAVVLYRFNYILPLSFVAAFAFVKAFESLFQKRRKGNNRGISAGRQKVFAGITSVIILAGLVGLLFPINNRWIYAPFSRMYTLNRLSGNDAGLWKDLIEFTGKFQNRLIITDPMTGRVLTALYPTNTCIGLQWMESIEPEKEYNDAIKQRPDLAEHGIIIINRRDGDPSITGRIARHWPEDVLKMNRYYSPMAIDFVENQTNRFKLLWGKDRIEVFQIIP